MLKQVCVGDAHGRFKYNPKHKRPTNNKYLKNHHYFIFQFAQNNVFALEYLKLESISLIN
jgi:hypothetical protein